MVSGPAQHIGSPGGPQPVGPEYLMNSSSGWVPRKSASFFPTNGLMPGRCRRSVKIERDLVTVKRDDESACAVLGETDQLTIVASIINEGSVWDRLQWTSLSPVHGDGGLQPPWIGPLPVAGESDVMRGHGGIGCA